mmetsp:Transcript_48615/g.109502  ORF Transcript_48615/g.109502 Transcript_48615/m.109502 type:complete len:131 (-) Transcript_48615:288-680(-)
MDPSIFTLIRLGFLTLPCRFGWGNFVRLNAMLDASGAMQREALGTKGDMWSVEAFAIKSTARGKGIGSKLLTKLMHERMRAAGATRLILMTQEEMAHRLYLRLGFIDVDVRPLELKDGVQIPNWTMEWRP